MPFKPASWMRRSRNGMAIPLALASLILTAGLAHAADPCSGVKRTLTDARKREYSALVATSMNEKVGPAQVKIRDFMESGAWSAVYVSTPVSDDGVLFFQAANGARRFKDVWAGSADPSERPQLIDWARKLGAPDNLARCFAHIVTN